MYCIYQLGTITIFSVNNILVSEKAWNVYLIQLCHLSFPSERRKKAKLSLKFCFELTATLSLSDLFVQSY